MQIFHCSAETVVRTPPNKTEENISMSEISKNEIYTTCGIKSVFWN